MSDVARAAGDDLPAALAAGEEWLLAAQGPVADGGPDREAWEKAIDERIRRIGVKIAPGMPPAQSKPWRDALTEALSDLPAMVSLTAAKRAIHTRMSFLNEVEGAVRDQAAIVLTELRGARARLDRLREHIERPPVPALPPPQEAAPLSLDEIRKLPGWLRKAGLDAGAITQAEIDEATAETSV